MDTVIVPRAQTQAILDARIRAAMAIDPMAEFTIADQFEQIVARQPLRSFLHYHDQTWSYAEVEARANRLARAVLRLGLAKGDTCAVGLDNRPDFFTVWFGLAKAGIKLAFLNTNISGRPLAHALKITGARAAIVGDEVLAGFLPPESRATPVPMIASTACAR